MKKIAVFADVQNLYYTVRQAHGCHFDYAALWADISRDGQIVEAYAYAIDRGDAKQQQFQQILRNLGFTVKLKPYIQRSDGSAKGDWDVGICIDILDAVARVDQVVLASGDGDFDLLLDKVRSQGVEAVAYGVPGLTAQSLVRAASRYVPIEGALLLRN
ncbi:NYN domain-containing protein [Pseudomonas sp. CrR25]|nr:NYN domain-containing protein [Pseudomonas sp. CrR25]